ncbi:hypothetical protein [Alkalibacillus aidingensis]|uniref:hypothetical protein n=1 Tax=Alkalibacillus aidingensis TaxID=2747607 RepID=UPI001660F178|nr:hypothetical protein [Alkalibacillus aidingensis]
MIFYYAWPLALALVILPFIIPKSNRKPTYGQGAFFDTIFLGLGTILQRRYAATVINILIGYFGMAFIKALVNNIIEGPNYSSSLMWIEIIITFIGFYAINKIIIEWTHIVEAEVEEEKEYEKRFANRSTYLANMNRSTNTGVGVNYFSQDDDHLLTDDSNDIFRDSYEYKSNDRYDMIDQVEEAMMNHERDRNEQMLQEQLYEESDNLTNFMEDQFENDLHFDDDN